MLDAGFQVHFRLPGFLFGMKALTKKTSKVSSSYKSYKNKMEIYHMEMKTGSTLKLKGKIDGDASWFSINLGSGPGDLALHFNPRFEENVIVCNSQNGGTWEQEHRDDHMCFRPGMEIKLIVTFEEDEFQVKLPDGHQVKFPNRGRHSHLPYFCVKGGIHLTSFKLE